MHTEGYECIRYADHKPNKDDQQCECWDFFGGLETILNQDRQKFFTNGQPSRPGLVTVMEIGDPQHEVKAKAEVEGKQVVYGVYALSDIEPFEYCQPFTGIVYTGEEMNNILKAKPEFASMYAYAFEWQGNEIFHPDDKEESKKLVVDASELAVRNPTGYVNHSEEANLRSLHLLVHGTPMILFFNPEKIQKGDELLLHYGKRFWQGMEVQKRVEQEARADANAKLRIKTETKNTMLSEKPCETGAPPFCEGSTERPTVKQACIMPHTAIEKDTSGCSFTANGLGGLSTPSIARAGASAPQKLPIRKAFSTTIPSGRDKSKLPENCSKDAFISDLAQFREANGYCTETQPMRDGKVKIDGPDKGYLLVDLSHL